jgi:hypothetical protein
MEVLILRELRARFAQVLKLRDLADCRLGGNSSAGKILWCGANKASGPAKGAAP